MTLLTIKPFISTAPTGSGFNIALGEAKAGQFIQFSINKAAQIAAFGRALTKDDEVLLAIDNAAGRNHLVGISLAKEGQGFPVIMGARDSARFKVAPWRQVPKGKLPSVSMQLVASDGGVTLLKLPNWARPDAQKAT